MHVVEIDNSKIFQTHSYRHAVEKYVHLNNILYKSCVLGINAYIYLGLISSYLKLVLCCMTKSSFFPYQKTCMMKLLYVSYNTKGS